MADWSIPTVSSNYADVLTYLKDRDIDAGTLFLNAPSNQPTGSIRYLRASNKFQEWDGAAWVDKVLAVAGGGTGGSSAASARSALGLGTMAVQDSSSVNISGGTLAGNGAGITALIATNIASGLVPTARLGTGTASSSSFLRGDQTYAAIIFDILYGADQSGTFTPVSNTFYNLTGAGATINLPTVVGNGGKIIGLIMKAAGSWIIDPNGSETILGAATYTFDWGLGASIILKADATGGKWDVI
jgi:hypothetical protein